MNSLQWLQFVLSYLFQASLVIGVAWALERWVHAAETKTRIWTACFVSLLGLLIIGLVLPRLEWLHPWSGLGPNELLNIASVEHVMGRILLAVWIGGACVMLTRWVIQSLAIRKFIRSCPELTTSQQDRLWALLPPNALRVNRRDVSLRQSPEELGPFCYQFHEPLVFLPISLIEGDKAELRHVLTHELTHLATQHPMQLFAQKVVQVVLWFHPLVWISSRRANLVREFVCDDAATGDEASTASYLRTLLRIVERRAAPRGGTFSLGRTVGELKLRAQRLVSERKQRFTWWAGWTPIFVCMMAVLASQLWVPTNPLASPYSHYSPWPAWTASTLHTFGISVRDFERFDSRTQIHELIEDSRDLDAQAE